MSSVMVQGTRCSLHRDEKYLNRTLGKFYANLERKSIRFNIVCVCAHVYICMCVWVLKKARSIRDPELLLQAVTCYLTRGMGTELGTSATAVHIFNLLVLTAA